MEEVVSKINEGCRDLPIRPELALTMARLVKAGKDGLVFSGLALNKHGDRSNTIGGRFGRLQAEHMFNSVRKTASTLLENAKGPENVSAEVTGHEKETMTDGVYYGGALLTVKAQVIAKLEYLA